MDNNINKYNDIINLTHHVSTKHPQMSNEARAAQFSPFAALVGYGDEINETVRLTNERIDIDEELKSVLDNKLKRIKEQISLRPKIVITYFVPDLMKDGGKYVTAMGSVKKIDEYKKLVIFDDKTEIPISDIIEINGDILENTV